MNRIRYLVCYDIASAKRLYHARKRIKEHAISGQKSCYECLFTDSELKSAEQDLLKIINGDEDRIHLFQLDPRQQPDYFGEAVHQPASPFLIF